MRKILSILSSALFVCLIMSCDDDIITYDDKLKEENIVVEKFVKDSKFVVLNDFPADGIFKENEYVLLKNGVYLHVVDYGDSKYTPLGTKVSTIAKGEILNQKEVKPFNGFEPESDWLTWPIIFRNKEVNYPPVDDYIVGLGYMSALKYVGNNSIVKMLIPSKVGSGYQYDNACPAYFEKVCFLYMQE